VARPFEDAARPAAVSALTEPFVPSISAPPRILAVYGDAWPLREEDHGADAERDERHRRQRRKRGRRREAVDEGIPRRQAVVAGELRRACVRDGETANAVRARRAEGERVVAESDVALDIREGHIDRIAERVLTEFRLIRGQELCPKAR